VFQDGEEEEAKQVSSSSSSSLSAATTTATTTTTAVKEEDKDKDKNEQDDDESEEGEDVDEKDKEEPPVARERKVRKKGEPLIALKLLPPPSPPRQRVPKKPPMSNVISSSSSGKRKRETEVSRSPSRNGSSNYNNNNKKPRRVTTKHQKYRDQNREIEEEIKADIEEENDRFRKQDGRSDGYLPKQRGASAAHRPILLDRQMVCSYYREGGGCRYGARACTYQHPKFTAVDHKSRQVYIQGYPLAGSKLIYDPSIKYTRFEPIGRSNGAPSTYQVTRSSIKSSDPFTPPSASPDKKKIISIMSPMRLEVSYLHLGHHTKKREMIDFVCYSAQVNGGVHGDVIFWSPASNVILRSSDGTKDIKDYEAKLVVLRTKSLSGENVNRVGELTYTEDNEKELAPFSANGYIKLEPAQRAVNKSACGVEIDFFSDRPVSILRYWFDKSDRRVDVPVYLALQEIYNIPVSG